MMQNQVILAQTAGARVELRTRVFTLLADVPHLHAGGDWCGDPLARWYFLMPRSSRPKKNWARAACFRTGICRRRKLWW